MPKVTFGSEHRATSAFDYPKVFLEKGETALLLMIEQEPTMEYVHTLRAPQLVNGKVVMEEVTNFGKTQMKPKMDFIGRHICIGSPDIIADKGVDVKGCPVCKASTETDAVSAPERRFAVHVIRYKTKPGSFQVQEPFSVELLAWTFGDKVFNQIVDFAEEWGDLRKHDLKLGPCEVRQFQKFDIQVSAQAAWLASDERKQLVAETYKQNQAKDLSALIARRIGRELVEEDLFKVLQRHKQAFGRDADEPGEALPAGDVAGGMDLDDLLGGDSTPDVASTPETSPEPDSSAAEDLNPSEVTPAAAEGKQEDEERPKEKVPAGEALDLDDLLADL